MYVFMYLMTSVFNITFAALCCISFFNKINQNNFAGLFHGLKNKFGTYFGNLYYLVTHKPVKKFL